jgi:hypothetical protein
MNFHRDAKAEILGRDNRHRDVMRLVALALALFLLPTADAGSMPALYFLRDASFGPAAPGLMDVTPPDSLDPSVRWVPPVDLEQARFFANETPAPFVRGPVFVGYWPGPSLVYSGNVTVSLLLVHENGTVDLISSASRNATFDPTQVDPTSFIPPDPTNPQGSAAHIQGKLLQTLLKPPVLYYLSTVDIPVPNGTRVAVSFRLDAMPGELSSSGMATVQYDGQTSPTFAYVPWFTPDPPRNPTPTKTTTSTTKFTSAPGSTPGTSTPAKDTPLDPAVFVGALAVALLLRRR